jgi:hypothetical protein
MSSLTKTIIIKGYPVIIDEEDLAKVEGFTWRAHKIKDQPWLIYFRSYTTGSHTTRKEVLLHRLIAGGFHKDGIVIDHRDGDTLNNCKTNLRRCTTSQNTSNARKMTGKSSPYKGVTLDAKTGKWKVTITHKGVSEHLGYFTDIILAARTYNNRAQVLFKEFARLNPLPEED